MIERIGALLINIAQTRLRHALSSPLPVTPIGAAMTSVEGFLLGLMVAWIPCLIVFALLLWRAPVIEDGRAGQ